MDLKEYVAEQVLSEGAIGDVVSPLTLAMFEQLLARIPSFTATFSLQLV
jgi:hypothetical protein